MTIIFNSNKLPHRNTNTPFGFVQERYEPISFTDFDEKIPKCKKCKSRQFPTKSGNFSCPICSPESDFVEGSIRIKKNSQTKLNLLYYFVFEVQFSIDKTICLLKQLCDLMNDEDSVVLICVSSALTLLSIQNGIPIFTVVDDITRFIPKEEYKLTKKNILEYVFPTLQSIYSIRSSNNDQKPPINVIPLIQLLVRQSQQKPFSAFCFFNSPIAPLTAEKAAAASRSVSLNHGVIHFGVNEGFQRLTAISQLNMGVVFGVQEILPTTISRLVKLSHRTKMKIVMPRFMEVTKVTSSDGSMNMAAYTTKIKLTNIKGGSARLSVDFSRIDDDHIIGAKFIEITENSSGKFVSLHAFGWAESPEIFDSIAFSQKVQLNLPKSLSPTADDNPAKSSNDSPAVEGNSRIFDFDQYGENIGQFVSVNNRNLTVTKNLFLKGCASDVLRATWAGQDFTKVVDNLMKDPKIKDFVSSSCLAEALKKQERGAEKFYYVLFSLLDDRSDKVLRVKKDIILITPPIVFIYTSLENPSDVFEKYIKSEWPFEIRVLTDLGAFLLMAKNQGFDLFENKH